jgi:hypothetical protein
MRGSVSRWHRLDSVTETNKAVLCPALKPQPLNGFSLKKATLINRCKGSIDWKIAVKAARELSPVRLLREQENFHPHPGFDVL